jgi:ABC-type maltose transport system permease subunit
MTTVEAAQTKRRRIRRANGLTNGSQVRAGGFTRILTWTVMALLMILSLVPLLVVVKTSILDPRSYFGDSQAILPKNTTIFNYKRVLGMVSKEESIAVGGSGAEFFGTVCSS